MNIPEETRIREILSVEQSILWELDVEFDKIDLAFYPFNP